MYDFWNIGQTRVDQGLCRVVETFLVGPNGVVWSKCDVSSHHHVPPSPGLVMAF